jgi:hypothetical protein
MDRSGRSNPAEKRKVGGSTPPLTTGLTCENVRVVSVCARSVRSLVSFPSFTCPGKRPALGRIAARQGLASQAGETALTADGPACTSVQPRKNSLPPPPPPGNLMNCPPWCRRGMGGSHARDRYGFPGPGPVRASLRRQGRRRLANSRLPASLLLRVSSGECLRRCKLNQNADSERVVRRLLLLPRRRLRRTAPPPKRSGR